MARGWTGWRLAARCAALAAGYAALLLASYLTADIPGRVGTLWWLPVGLAAGFLVLTPPSAWRPLLLSVAGTSLLLGLLGIPPQRTIPSVVALAWSATNALSPLAAALVCRALGQAPFDLRSTRNVVVLVGPAALAAATVNLVLGFVSQLAWPGEPPPFSPFVLFAAEALGVISVAPLVLTATSFASSIHGRQVEALFLLLALGWTAWAAFGQPATGLQVAALASATFPVLGWAALRFGPFGAAWAAFVLMSWATAHTRAGLGPFAAAGRGPVEGLAWVEIFFGLATASSLFLAAVWAERRRSEQAAQQALLDAQEAIRVRDEFLSVASHELKTPLTPLSIRLGILERRAASGQQVSAEAIGRARSALARLNDLVEGLLDVDRLGAVETLGPFEPFSLRELVDEVTAPYRNRSIRHRLEVDLPDDPVEICGDRRRLFRVLDDIVDNAFKFSPRGGRVRVRLSVEGERAFVSVADEGIGIPMADRDRLFQRFSRGSNVPSYSYGGLGLGLYLGQAIVRRHGGAIRVESEVGRGSTFVVELPLRPFPAAPDDAVRETLV